MNKSPKYGFNLPNSENPEELADINAISENFLKTEQELESLSRDVKKWSHDIEDLSNEIRIFSEDLEFLSNDVGKFSEDLENLAKDTEEKISETKQDLSETKQKVENLEIGSFKERECGNPVILKDISSFEQELKVILSGYQVESVDKVVSDGSVSLGVFYTIKEVTKEQFNDELYGGVWRISLAFDELSSLYVYERYSDDYEPPFELGDKIKFKEFIQSSTNQHQILPWRKTTNFLGRSVTMRDGFGNLLGSYPSNRYGEVNGVIVEDEETIRLSCGVDENIREIDIVVDYSKDTKKAIDKKADKTEVANAIKETVSGNPIRIDDSSTIEHEIKINTSEGGATVQKYGKNLIPYPYINIPMVSAGVSFTANGDGAITMNGNATSTPSITFSFATLPKGTYRISSGVASSHGVSVRVYDSEGTNIGHSIASSIQSFTITEPTDVTFRVVGTSGTKYENLVVYPQLEVGKTATGFEPYKEPITYIADGNGNVSGIVANGENMTLFAYSGLTISAEYNVDTKKYIDKKFAELQALVLEV